MQGEWRPRDKAPSTKVQGIRISYDTRYKCVKGSKDRHFLIIRMVENSVTVH